MERQTPGGAQYTAAGGDHGRRSSRQLEKLVATQTLDPPRLVAKWNFSIEADALWSRVAKNPATRREALDALYHLYRDKNELRRLYEVLQQLHQTAPSDAAITANLARLGLVLDQNTEEAHR